MDEFARAFPQADSVQVLDIYAASENPIEGITSQALVDRMRSYGHRGANYAASMPEGIAAVSAAAQSGDAIITLGAGNVSQAAGSILEQLTQEPSRSIQ
jgi:UDP-N-acetylmuramate--alanine ligase